MSKEVNLLQGLEQFLSIFGNITIADVVVVVLALIFVIALYRKISSYLMKKHDLAQEKDAQLREVLESVKKYPEYRQQSIEVQHHLEDEISELKTAWHEVCERLTKLEEQNKKKERNKLRDVLLERYRYYTDKSRNPSQTWTTMESEAFWELFRDYEDAGGDGYMHTIVQPEMERLNIIEV